MNRYEELQQAYVRSAKRDEARLERLRDKTRFATGKMLTMLVQQLREHLGRPADTRIAYFVQPETGEQLPDDDIWAHLKAEMVPDDGNGYHADLVVAVSWPEDDGRHYASGVASPLEVIPLRDGRWTIAFEERASHSPMPIDTGDPTTLTAFADEVFAVVREYFDTYALPPDAPSRRTLGFLRRI